MSNPKKPEQGDFVTLDDLQTAEGSTLTEEVLNDVFRRHVAQRGVVFEQNAQWYRFELPAHKLPVTYIERESTGERVLVSNVAWSIWRNVPPQSLTDINRARERHLWAKKRFFRSSNFRAERVWRMFRRYQVRHNKPFQRYWPSPVFGVIA